MANSFVTSGATAKGRYSERGHKQADFVWWWEIWAPRDYPITDDFASREIPGYAARCESNNRKSGWNTAPARNSRTGMVEAERVSAPERGRGK